MRVPNSHIDFSLKKNFQELPQQRFVGLQNVLKAHSRHVLKASSTRVQRNNFLSSKTSSRRLQDIKPDSSPAGNYVQR